MFGLTIRTKNSEGMTPLYTRLKIEGKSKWVNLQLLVDIEKWNKVSSSVRKQTNYLDSLGHSEKLYEIEVGMKDLRLHHRLTFESLNVLIQNVVLSETREQLVKDEQLKKDVEERRRKDVKTYIENYVKGVSNGTILNKKGKMYSKNSIKSWKQFLRLFKECYRNQSFIWDELDQHRIHMFLNFLEKKGYMGETRNRHIGVYGTLISVSELEGLHNNGKCKRWLSSPVVNDDEKKKGIYLDKDELDSLFNMSLSGLHEKVRDVFLIGCYTGQRFSDYSKIEEGCIGVTEKGTRVIRLVQQKTRCKVSIPILNDELEILLKKYDYTVPTLCEQVLNRYIKEICQQLSETVPSLNKLERTLLTKTERDGEKIGKMEFKHDDEGHVVKHRWEMVSSHTARRTMITNMYLSGKFSTSQIMSVSGHKKEETFRKYIKLSLDEFADDVAKSANDGLF